MSTASQQPWTVGTLLNWTAGYLAKKSAESPRLDAELLLAFVLECERIDLYGTKFAEPATEAVRQRYRELIQRRVEGCPVAYLVGRKEFFSLRFEVNSHVLIPRPDTETIVIECLRLAKEQVEPRILDVGTGSGAIAIAIAQRHKKAQVTALDLSEDALAVARRNAQRNGVVERVRFLLGDLLAPVAGEKFDFILSNPPYIAKADLANLPPGVRDYEPHLALDGGPDGYAVFDRLIDQARTHFLPGGYLLLEIGSTQEGPARQKLTAYPDYELRPTIKDGGGHPRVLIARLVSGR